MKILFFDNHQTCPLPLNHTWCCVDYTNWVNSSEFDDRQKTILKAHVSKPECGEPHVRRILRIDTARALKVTKYPVTVPKHNPNINTKSVSISVMLKWCDSFLGLQWSPRYYFFFFFFFSFFLFFFFFLLEHAIIFFVIRTTRFLYKLFISSGCAWNNCREVDLLVIYMQIVLVMCAKKRIVNAGVTIESPFTVVWRS